MKTSFLSLALIASFIFVSSAFAGRDDDSESTGSRHAKKLSHSKSSSHKKRVSHDSFKANSSSGGHRVNLSVKSKEDENLSRNVVMPIQWNPDEPLTFNVIYKDIQMKIRIDHQ